MDKMDARNSEDCFAALKLIERLFKDGHIPGFIFRNILNDYVDVVDGANFANYYTNESL